MRLEDKIAIVTILERLLAAAGSTAPRGSMLSRIVTTALRLASVRLPSAQAIRAAAAIAAARDGSGAGG